MAPAADTLGPEKYAPPDRRPPEKPSDAEIIALLRRQRDDINPANSATENLSAPIRRVSGQSMQEIDLVIRELQNVRDMLCNEGERVSREITSFASLSHSLMSAMKMISDSLQQWKVPP